MKDIPGKVAFITGGASGIGLGVAGAFVEAGMQVVLADLRQDHIDEALAVFKQRGRAQRVHAIRVLSKNRPPQFGVGDAFREAEEAGGTKVAFPSLMDPAEVGALVLQAVRNDELYIITHGEWRPMAAARHAALLAAMPEKLDPALVAMLQARPPSPAHES